MLESDNLLFLSLVHSCQDSEFGHGKVGDEAKASCKEDEVGEKTAVCTADGNWDLREDTCILKVINSLVVQSQVKNKSPQTFLLWFLLSTQNITRSSVLPSTGLRQVRKVIVASWWRYNRTM